MCETTGGEGDIEQLPCCGLKDYLSGVGGCCVFYCKKVILIMDSSLQ